MNEHAGLFRRMSTTPMRDWIRGRLSGSLDWRRVIANAGLPGVVSDRIGEVVGRTRLWRRERVDVARELIGHFADGIEAGRTPDELVSTFGDAKEAALLIRRAKKRARPMWWQAQRLVGHLCLGLIAAYAVLAIWYFARSPEIKRNMTAEMNAPVISVPEADRAWPLYLRAIREWPVLPTVLEAKGEEGYRGFNTIRSGDAKWVDLVAHMTELDGKLELLREAASKPVFGYVMNRDERALVEVLNARAVARDPAAVVSLVPKSEDNPWLFGVLLPYFGEMRSFSWYLQAQTFVAAEAGDARRVVKNLEAMVAMSEQVRTPSLLISELVGYAMYSLACETLMELVHRSPGLLSDGQLGELAHRFGAFDLSASRYEQGLDGEKAFMDDTLQRVYADDGSGGGRLTPEGLRLLTQVQSLSGATVPSNGVDRVLTVAGGPLAAVVFASRSQIRWEYQRFMDDSRAQARTPMWEWDQNQSSTAEIERKMHESWTYRVRYMPLKLLMPALGSATRAYQQTVMRRDVTLAVIGCEVFKRRTGSYPRELSQLVPRELPWLPVDCYDGKAIRLKLAGASLLLYSVGANRTDEGGIGPDGKADGSSWWKAAVRTPGLEPKGDWVLYPPAQ
jgi:hypothetical protein